MGTAPGPRVFTPVLYFQYMPAGGSCPKCSAMTELGEKFCAKCGFRLQADARDGRAVAQSIGARSAKQGYQQKIKSGRTTILVVGILLFLNTAVIYFIPQGDLRKAENEVRMAKGNEEYDQDLVLAQEREIAKARGLIRLFVGAFFLLACTFIGLWVWAKSKPLPATLTALILFIALQAFNLAVEPETMIRGILVKVIVLVALVSAVSAAAKYQKMSEAGV
jgi:hypothetical protein